jgi:hypothetical protein
VITYQNVHSDDDVDRNVDYVVLQGIGGEVVPGFSQMRVDEGGKFLIAMHGLGRTSNVPS